MKAVMNTIQQIVTAEEIKQNLMDMGFDVVAISRMYKKIWGGKIDMLLILVLLA